VGGRKGEDDEPPDGMSLFLEEDFGGRPGEPDEGWKAESWVERRGEVAFSCWIWVIR
jgi:hypothetical protein